jgi:transposase-like protein
MQGLAQAPARSFSFGQDIEAQFRRHIREALDVALAEEIAVALGSDRHERTEQRRGYRNGTVERSLTTPEGTRTVTIPRGRIAGRDRETREFHSQLLPRYAQRTREIDEAIKPYRCEAPGTRCAGHSATRRSGKRQCGQRQR